MFDFGVFATAEGWISLVTLTAMEIGLGIDNIVFVSISTGKLPEEGRPRTRALGISLALFMRLGLLFAISWMMRLTRPLLEVLGRTDRTSGYLRRNRSIVLVRCPVGGRVGGGAGST